MQKPLQIKLCDTLSHFLAENDRQTGSKTKKVFAGFTSSSQDQTTQDIALNTKYLLPQWRVASNAKPTAGMQLLITPQQIAWGCGNMPILFYKGDAEVDSTYRNLETDVEDLFSILHEESRLEPMYFRSLPDFVATHSDLEAIQFYPCDELANNMTVLPDPRMIYELQTKRALALSGLPTPETDVLEIQRYGATPDAVIEKAMNAVKTREIPFVLKTNYGAGARGTYLIYTDDDRERLLRELAIKLPRDIEKINDTNKSLHPCDIILQSMLPSVALDSINFYVYSNGHVKFSSCTQQHFSDDKFWNGARIVYSRQSTLAEKYNEIMLETGQFLHAQGYFGPAGIDVLATEAGEIQVVDLNARTTSTFQLGCFRDHFVETLHFDAAAVVINLEYSGDRFGFQRLFASELSKGEMVITARFTRHDPLTTSICAIVGARDEVELAAKCANIRSVLHN